MKTLISFIIILMSFPTATPTAKEIVGKAENQLRGKSSKGEVTIKIVRPKWSREMSMKTWSFGKDHSLTIITSPAKDKGTGFLMREKEVWNWIPSVEKLIKLPPSMMMQSWMGTDFTNDDLVNQTSVVDDYEHKILAEETVSGRKCWKIEMIPHEDAPIVWGKVELWIDQQDYIQLKIKSYDEDMDLVNTLIASDIKVMDGRNLATHLEMIPANEPGNKTILIQNSIDFDIDIDKNFFTPQNMKTIRI